MQTREGALKAKETVLRKYGVTEDGKSALHVRAGRIGGERGRTGGWASEVVGKDGLTGRQRASVLGAVGGRISKRRPRR